MFQSERHNIFNEEINKIALSSNDDKRIQSIDSIEMYYMEQVRSSNRKRRYSM